MPITSLTRKFILHWGEMGSRWGINRTVAQVHALLYLSSKPLDAEEIAKTLGVARSNVSTSLRELQSWGIVKVVHVLGDRRDQFESLKDVWHLFQLVLEERKKREIDPTVAMLREMAAELDQTHSADSHTKQQVRQMLEFFEAGMACYQDMRRLSPETLRKFSKMSGKIQKLLGMLK